MASDFERYFGAKNSTLPVLPSLIDQYSEGETFDEPTA
jgi:hypothetical protein